MPVLVMPIDDSARTAHASSPEHVFDGFPAAPIALVVAHPDDEVIGVGGQLPTWAPWLTCVLATDGAPDDASAWRAGCLDAHAYAAARVRESCAALARAGIQPSQLVRLTFEDQRLALELEALSASLQRLLKALRPAIVITHAYEGGHPDHDALSLAVRAAAGETIPVLEFAGYHEDEHGGLATNRFAPPETGTELRLPLNGNERHRKRAMLDCFETQRDVLARFDVAEEWLRVAPHYDYRQPPNDGRVWYDRFGWAVSSGAWIDNAERFLHSTAQRKGL